MTESGLRDWYMRYIAAPNAHELDGMDEFIADEVLLGGEPGTRDAVVGVLKGIVDAVPDIHWEVEELLFDRDGIAVRAINTGTPAKEWLGVPPRPAPRSRSSSSPSTIMDTSTRAAVDRLAARFARQASLLMRRSDGGAVRRFRRLPRSDKCRY